MCLLIIFVCNISAFPRILCLNIHLEKIRTKIFFRLSRFGLQKFNRVVQAFGNFERELIQLNFNGNYFTFIYV